MSCNHSASTLTTIVTVHGRLKATYSGAYLTLLCEDRQPLGIARMTHIWQVE